MAKLYFRYSAMNAGKSTELLKDAHNYEERGLAVRLFTAKIDTRMGEGVIYSRMGLSRKSEVFDVHTDFAALLAQPVDAAAIDARPTACVFIDEAQFLSLHQVEQLHRLTHTRDVPVICYGLRSDFQGKAFAGSAALLTLADNLEELKTICTCQKKASMNARFDGNGQRVCQGAQVHIGGNESYQAMCPACFYKEN
jgi:thymidine kinase